MNFKNYFREINFDEFDVVECVKARRALDKTINELYSITKNINIREFNAITNAAYGYLENPYKDIYGNIKTFISTCEQIIETRITLDVTLDYAVNALTNEQSKYLSLSPDYYFINLEVFQTKLDNVLESIDLLKEANLHKQEIFRKFLGIEENPIDSNDRVFYEFNYNAGRGVWTKYSLNDDGKSMDIDEYIYYDDKWTLYTSSKNCKSISSQTTLSHFGEKAFASLLPELVI